MITLFNSAARNLSPLIHLFHPINPCAMCLVTQPCLTLCNPMDCYPPGFSVCGFSRQEYWVAMPSSRGSSQPRDRTQVSCIIGRSFFFFFFNWRLNTILWCFLPYINMNQPRVYMCPTILNTPSTSLPTPSLWVVLEHHLHALNMHRSSVLHMAIYMFQCYCLSHQGSPSIPTFNYQEIFFICACLESKHFSTTSVIVSLI